MSLSQEQEKYLCQYLKDVGIIDQEPFEEFYDHIATGFETSEYTDIKEYIHNIAQPAFGGTKGMLKVVKEQNQIRKTFIWNRAREIFLSLFGWPAIIVVIACFLMVQIGTQLLGQKFIIVFSLVIGLAIPAIVVFYGLIVFHFECKRSGLPYRRNNLNNWLISFIHLPFALLNIGGNLIIPIIFGRETFKSILASYPIITICTSTFILLFGITYLRLIKEKFIFKLQLK